MVSAREKICELERSQWRQHEGCFELVLQRDSFTDASGGYHLAQVWLRVNQVLTTDRKNVKVIIPMNL